MPKTAWWYSTVQDATTPGVVGLLVAMLLLLPFCVFNAIRDAVASVGNYQIEPVLNAPATAEAVMRAVATIRKAK